MPAILFGPIFLEESLVFPRFRSPKLVFNVPKPEGHSMFNDGSSWFKAGLQYTEI